MIGVSDLLVTNSWANSLAEATNPFDHAIGSNSPENTSRIIVAQGQQTAACMNTSTMLPCNDAVVYSVLLAETTKNGWPHVAVDTKRFAIYVSCILRTTL